MFSTHIFIISWAGQHDNAIAISEQVLLHAKNVSIVYSDEHLELKVESKCNMIRRPNNLFWADKFKACLDACGDDPMLVIHADCQCDNWTNLIASYSNSVKRYKNIGVWAPNISGTYFKLKESRIAEIPKTSLSIVALTDGIVFALAPSIINRMRQVDYSKNIYGWGIDRLFCVTAHVTSQLVVIDEAVTVEHPIGCGYDSNAAEIYFHEFIKQLTLREQVEHKLLDSYLLFNHTKNSSIKKISVT